MHADKLPITGPCPIDLDAIGFDRQGRVSHCSHCSKNVHILSNMTKAEARRFLRDNRGKKLCVSYSKDEQGRIRFRPEPPSPAIVPVTRLQARPSRRAGLVATLGAGVALAACAPHGDEGRPTTAVQVQASTRPAPEIETKPETVPPVIETTPEPVPPVIEVRPEPVPMAGMMVVPEVTVDGEMEVPDPGMLDEPCDKTLSAKETSTGTMARL